MQRDIVALIIGLICGGLLVYTCFPRTITKEISIEKPVVETKVEYKDRTQIQYVPKDIIINPQTGQKELEKTDVQINKDKTKVYVKVNGKEYAFDLLENEQQKFDDGKITLDQSSTLSVDVSAQVEQQITNGIKKAFEDQKKNPQYRLGINPEFSVDDKPTYNLRLSRQAESVDFDLKVDKDKNVRFGATWWLK